MAKELKLTTIPVIDRNVSVETLETAAEMFIYLTSCLTAQKHLGLITHLLHNTTPKKIILAMISMIKSSENVEKKETVEIFNEIMKSFNLNQYEEIQIITKGQCYTNGTFGDCTKKTNVTNKDIPTLLGFLDKIKRKFIANFLILSVGSKMLQRMTNHPVHIHNNDGQLFPTALIPFCEFGGNISVMGVNIDQFNVPVCTSFRPKIIRDQLCYTVDPNKYKHKIDLKGELSLSLYIHYNEDRQLEDNDNIAEENFLILDTIGETILKQN